MYSTTFELFHSGPGQEYLGIPSYSLDIPRYSADIPRYSECWPTLIRVLVRVRPLRAHAVGVPGASVAEVLRLLKLKPLEQHGSEKVFMPTPKQGHWAPYLFVWLVGVGVLVGVLVGVGVLLVFGSFLARFGSFLARFSLRL